MKLDATDVSLKESNEIVDVLSHIGSHKINISLIRRNKMKRIKMDRKMDVIGLVLLIVLVGLGAWFMIGVSSFADSILRGMFL